MSELFMFILLLASGFVFFAIFFLAIKWFDKI